MKSCSPSSASATDQEKKLTDMTNDKAAQEAALKKLRAPFEKHQISVLPKPYEKEAKKGKCSECGGFHGLPAVHLDYVGHAALTDRLLEVDPFWTWEPLAYDERGMPALDAEGGMWIKLTVCGMTRLGYGDAQGKKGPNATKERIGDALRNAAMRFGAALDLWHKGILHMDTDPEPQVEESAPAVRHAMSDKAFQKALEAIRAGDYTLPEIEAAYKLTPEQQALAVELEIELKMKAKNK
jgi:hypothetical protein